MAGPVGEALGGGPGDDPPQVGLGRLLGPGDQDSTAGRGHDGVHLEPGRGHRVAVDGQAAGVRGRVVGGQDQAAVQPGRHPGDDLDPGRVVLGGQLGGGPGVGVGGQDPGGGLVAGLDEQGQGAAGVPGDRDQVRVGLAVPGDLDLAAVQVDDVEADVGVVGAGGRVGEGDGLDRRVGRVGQVEPPDPADVGPGHGQALPVRGPPEPTGAAHLLGGQELGQAPGDLRVVLADESPGVLVDRRATASLLEPPGPEVGDVEGAAGDPGHLAAGRVDPWVEHALAGRQLPDLAVGVVEGGHEQAAGQGEAGHGQVQVGGEGDDAAGPLPGPLAAGPLLGRQVLGAVAEQGGRVGDEPLGPRGQVEDPQPVDRVVAGGRAQEGHPGAVGPDLEPAWPPEREPRVRACRLGKEAPTGASQSRRPGRPRRRRGPRPGR